MSRLWKMLTTLITVLCVAGVGVVLYIQTQDDNSYEVTAYFEKTIGLFENSDVTILGVPVGKVTDVQPSGTRVRVEMVIDAEHRVPANATAQIVPISVISDRYIQLAPIYSDGPVLEDGATIPQSRTRIPAELDDVFKQLKKLLDALKPQEEGQLGSLGELIVSLNEALKGREQDLKGTLIQGSRLTQTLARARSDISGLLVNLDTLFEKLAPHAGSITSLNQNFATVMRFLAENRSDLEGTLANLATMTDELARLVRDHRGRLSSILTKGVRITGVILKNKQSIEQSLAWLGVVGEGLKNAYHGGEVKATDVRSNRNTASNCEDFDDLPIDPDDFPPALGDLLEQIFDAIEEEFCPNPSPGPAPSTSVTGPSGTVDPPDLLPGLQLDCDKSVRNVKRQIRRIEEIGIPEDVKSSVLEPLKEKLELLAEKCEELAEIFEDPDKLRRLLKGLPLELLHDLMPPDSRQPQETDNTAPDEDVNANAAGTLGVPTSDSPSFGERVGSWASNVLGFLGVS